MEFGRTLNRIVRVIQDPRRLVTYVIVAVMFQCKCLTGSKTTELPRFTMCNTHIDMSQQQINQGVLELVIRDIESTNSRVSCDVTIDAGYDKHVMFYVTDLYLGAPNGSYRIEKACIEPRDVDGYDQSRIMDMRRSSICSKTEVELGSRVYATKGNGLSIRFYRNRGFNLRAHLKIVFTAFRLGSCRTTERKCRNDRCIAHDIVCNDHNPCGDYSDCPTGLEHLSSWAMSGIVILAILAGGIIIIMATVCLQRTGSKQSDWDDLSTTMVGVRTENNVELTDVIATTTERRIHNSRNDDFGGNARVKPESVPLFNGTSGRLKDMRISLERDNDNLIESDTCPIMYPHNVNDSDLNTPFDSFETAERSSETATTTVSSHNLSHTDALENNAMLVPEVASTFHPRRTPDAFSASDNSIVLTDSDSGNEHEKTRLAFRDNIKPDKTSKSQKFLSQTNGLLQQHHNPGKQHGNNVFSDFKPTPPPYGFVFT